MAHDCSKHLLPCFGYRGCYFELKERHARGDRLSDAELAFIGATERSSASNGHGWRSVDSLPLFAPAELDSILPPEDVALLQSLMVLGSDGNADFLG